MAHEQRRVRVCKLLGGSGVPEWRDDDCNLRPVVPFPGHDLLHRVIPGPAGVALALDGGLDAAKLGDDVDALVAEPADMTDAPAGLTEEGGAVLLVLDRAHGGDVDPEDALPSNVSADDVEAGQGADDRAGLPRVLRGEHQQRHDGEADEAQRAIE